MGDPRKHHFVPAFYLKQWATADGKLIEWSKPHKKIVPMRRHPNATAFEIDLYTFPDLLPETRQWFEKRFLKFTDDIASEALTRILAGQMANLSDLQKTGWARFLMTLRFRHPDAVVEIRHAIAKVWENQEILTKLTYERVRSSHDPATFDEFVARLSPDSNSRIELELLVAAMDNEQIGRQIISMPWGAIDLRVATRRLLTSDWPVELSLGATPPCVVLPLSPTKLFIACADVNAIRVMDKMDPDRLIAAVNGYVVGSARRYVFSTDERQKVFIENRMSSRMQAQPFFPTLALPPWPKLSR